MMAALKEILFMNISDPDKLKSEWSYQSIGFDNKQKKLAFPAENQYPM